MTRWSEYFTSLFVALVALKVVDVSLERVEEALKMIDFDRSRWSSQ